MIQIAPQMRILVAVEPEDFRRGIDGLMAPRRQRLKSDPSCGTLFVFGTVAVAASPIRLSDWKRRSNSIQKGHWI